MKYQTTTLLFPLLLLALVTMTTLSTNVYAEKSDANEKADEQFEKGHVKQADKSCEKEGYDGYLGENCGYLN